MTLADLTVLDDLLRRYCTTYDNAPSDVRALLIQLNRKRRHLVADAIMAHTVEVTAGDSR